MASLAAGNLLLLLLLLPPLSPLAAGPATDTQQQLGHHHGPPSSGGMTAEEAHNWVADDIACEACGRFAEHLWTNLVVDWAASTSRGAQVRQREASRIGREMLEQLCAPVSVYIPSGRHYWHLLASPALGSEPALMPCVATVLGVH